MKKIKLLAALALTAGLLASCGGGDQPGESGASTAKSASTPRSSKFVAEWSKDPTKHVDPGCDHEGKDVEVCLNSSGERETKIDKIAHTFGAKGEKHEEEGKTGYWTAECSVCHSKAIILDALGFTKMDGTNKDESGATVKLASPNGSYVEYEFTMPENATSADIAVYGWVDYWYDNRNNNQERGFFNGSDPNVGVNINGKDLTITNKKTYEQMGMKAGENGNGSFTLCEMGAFGAIAAGPTKLTYTRLGSYNLNITEIWIIYK